MTNSISSHITKLGLNLPEPSAAVGNYVPRLRIGNMLYISGQLPVLNGAPQFLGCVSDKDDLSKDIAPCDVDTAIQAATLCCLNIIAQIAAEVGDDMDKVAHIVRLGGFVYSAPSFQYHAKVINGASDLMVNVFGAEVGTHVRAATGTSSLPLGVPVEIEAFVELR